MLSIDGYRFWCWNFCLGKRGEPVILVYFYVLLFFKGEQLFGYFVCCRYHILVCYFTASGSLHCEINNGGCWKNTQNGRTYSACVVSLPCVDVLKSILHLHPN